MSVPILDDRPALDPDPLRAAIRQAYRADEAACAALLLEEAAFDDARRRRVQAHARDLAQRVREARGDRLGVEAFLHEYGLSTPEGVMLMCLAEALLRIPDAETADRLIRDKLGAGDWAGHLGRSGSLLVNASTWGLMLTGRFVRVDLDEQGVASGFTRLVHRMGEPVVRTALLQAMRLLGQHFVLGQTIEQAIARADEAEGRGYRYSYDMLGEAARTAADARGYHDAYGHAIDAIVATARGEALMARPSISIKLSALHPRYEMAQYRRLPEELLPRLVDLAGRARAGNIAVTIDAEEADRLEPSLDLFERLLALPDFAGWDGLGLAVQAYQKRAIHVVAWLRELARRHRRRIPVRLVKGAYWDTEIKRAQEQGLAYPVLTRKLATDVSYLACARRLLDGGDAFYPQFATHNAHTIASIVELAGARRDLEFQRLHGMAEALYGSLIGADDAIACRVYAPVGSHNDLLPYLVRRLLENGANTSFVNQLMDAAIPIERLVEDPASRLAALGGTPHPKIVHPRDLYGPDRPNARGVDLRDPQALEALADAMNAAFAPDFVAAPTVPAKGTARDLLDPADRSRVIGAVVEASPADVDRALAVTRGGFERWDRMPLERRCACLLRAADLYEEHAAGLMACCVREGGKTLGDAVSEVREAVDFLRYYAAQARRLEHRDLPGPTGESNVLGLHGRGVFVTISPWNFPLAIFTGQVAAALVVGNAVVAKPAPQTPMIAARAVALLHRAGVPKDALVMLPGGAAVGERLVEAPGIAGVAFTGSTQVSRAINRALAAKDGPIVPLIAETGGQNVMLVEFLGLDRAGGRRRPGFGFPLRRSALLGAARALPAGYDRGAGRAHARRRHGRAAGRRSGAARDRCRAGDRRAGPRASCRARRAHAARGAPDPPRAARSRPGARLLLRAAGLRDREHRPAPGRGLRPHPARRPLCRRPAGCDARCGQRDRLRPHARRAQPRRAYRAARDRARPGRQSLCQPQHDRRGGGRAAVRRRRPFRHRAESRRPALSAALRDRAHGQRQYGRDRRQRGPFGPR